MQLFATFNACFIHFDSQSDVEVDETMKEWWAGSMKQPYENEIYIFISIALSHFKLYGEELSAT